MCYILHCRHYSGLRTLSIAASQDVEVAEYLHEASYLQCYVRSLEGTDQVS